MRLELSRFDEIAALIALDNPRRALIFVQDIRKKLADVQRNPLICQLRPDIAEEARMATVSKHVILFRVIGHDLVRIERVVFGGRDLPPVFDAV